MKRPNLKVGDWVEVRGKEEILKTLDSSGQLDGMPFMPEMFSFCGRRFQVYKRAHKTCDTVFPIRSRRVDGAVHLNTRCDGQAHGGCQAGCLLFWKVEWLKVLCSNSPEDAFAPINIRSRDSAGRSAAGCTESDVWANTQASRQDSGAPVYVCQATRLPYATRDLNWWDVRQYVEDYRSRNVGLWRLFCGFVYSTYYNISELGIGVGPAMSWFYDKFHPLWGGTPFPRKRGAIPLREATPSAALNLQPGELVRVRSHEEVLQTLNTDGKNRGMLWDAELVPFCGKTYRVLKRVNRIINEQTGEMQEMKNPCIVLDSVVCQSRYSACRMFCPRSIYPYWREIWLERVEAEKASPTQPIDRELVVLQHNRRVPSQRSV
jgi:hypothetical protein